MIMVQKLVHAVAFDVRCKNSCMQWLLMWCVSGDVFCIQQGYRTSLSERGSALYLPLVSSTEIH